MTEIPQDVRIARARAATRIVRWLALENIATVAATAVVCALAGPWGLLLLINLNTSFNIRWGTKDDG